MRVFLSFGNHLLQKLECCAEQSDGAEAERGSAQTAGGRETGDRSPRRPTDKKAKRLIRVRRPEIRNGREKLPDEEEKSSKCGEGREVAEKRMPVGPVPHPIGDPPNAAHVGMRPEHAVDDGREQGDRERDEDKL